MNTSEDEPSFGLNGRLRPRKSSCVPSLQNKAKSKTDGKAQARPNRTSAPSKATRNTQDDLTAKSDFSPTRQLTLCPYCDKKFASSQTMSKHNRRIHLPISNPETSLGCLFCSHSDADAGIMRHMVDNHPNQYFACLDCHTRFSSTSELAEHKLNVCQKQKLSYRTKLRQKPRGKKLKKSINVAIKDDAKEFQDQRGFNSIVISCELKPQQNRDTADIEDNITTNLILPPSKKLGNNSVLEKNAVIVLDDIHWNKRMPPNFSFHNADPDQILSRLGVVHRSPRTGESTKKDKFKLMDESTQKFERCFDTKFYSKVASNVQENMNKFLDGSCNFNPDPENTIKTRKTKNNVVINTAEGFPILLASEQFSRSAFDGYEPRAIAPKHKWKWENLENNRSVLDPDQIKRDSHTNNCIITLVSRLDIWTQLSMRRKFEEIYNYKLPVEKQTEKQKILSKELKEILESREIPSSSLVIKYTSNLAPLPAVACSSDDDGGAGFPAALGLVPAASTCTLEPAVLSGEWVRPRCYMCCACGEHTTDSKGVTSHISLNHPYAHVQYYEIVGEKLLNSDILKYLYVPPSQVSNRTRLPRGFKECTKCNKSVTLEELHQHMLDCAGDTPAMRRRQCRQRLFGVRRRRPRISENTIRKKIRKDIRSRQRRQKNYIRPRIRSEVGDAETIRKMLADLPAKRHRVPVHPANTTSRPYNRLDMQRNAVIMNKRCLEDIKLRNRSNANEASFSDAKMRAEACGDSSTHVSCPVDDEANNPSKPNDGIRTLQSKEDTISLKPKMKSLNNNQRQRESFKRQNLVAASKRESIRVKKIRAVESVEIADKTVDALSSTEIEFSSSAAVEELSVDKPPQRLNVKRASYNTRKHANRGTSGNRDGQRAGANGDNGGGNQNQPYLPPQNVPLKHSIASLTANSETHDKSVQFHHLFLVQQECNNTDQHVPSGQPPLFENEAVVSKLDKPPLNLCQKGFIDIQSFQKHKLNKPRKGLNDCIAMLKNKLVEPDPLQKTGHVSVQCGSDEPIDTEPRLMVTSTSRDAVHVQKEFHLVPTKDVALHEIIQDSAPKRQPIEGFHQEATTPEKPVIKTHNGKSNDTEIGISLAPFKSHEDIVGIIKRSPKTREANTEVTTPVFKRFVTNLNILQAKKKTAETDAGSKSMQTRSASMKTAVATFSLIEGIPSKSTDVEEIFTAAKLSESIFSKTNSISPAIENTSSKNPPPPPEINVTIGISIVSPKPIEKKINVITPAETNLCLGYDKRRCIELSVNENVSPKARLSSESIPPTLDVAEEHFKPQLEQLNEGDFVHGNSRIIPPKEPRFTWPNQPDKTAYSQTGKQKQHNSICNTDLHVEHDLNQLKPVGVFTECRVMDIPPAHASTKVGSILVAPLDLSSKVSVYKEPSNLNFLYDNYETLDLTKKSPYVRVPNTFFFEGDVVDLRVKPIRIESLNLCVKTGTINNYSANVPDNLSSPVIYPTDLSLKGKNTSLLHLPGPRNKDIVKYSLSSKPALIESGRLIASQYNSDVSSTDLMEKKNISASHADSSNISAVKKICEQVKLPNNQEQGSSIKQRRVSENLVTKVSQDKNSSLILKPVYDPTLKIPQYKIRDTTLSFDTSTTGKLLKTSAINSKIPQEIFPKTPGIKNTSRVFGSISRGALSGGVVLQTLPCPAITSSIRTESTIPVYTLANACLPVTKVESTKPNKLTNTLLSISESTIMHTSPVYTLTGTTVGGTNKFVSNKTDFLHVLTGQNCHSSAILHSQLFSPLNTEMSSTIEIVNINKDIADQDPDTARKIAMLPKELVEIIGNVPVDQRKQLLNILLQYVSTQKEAMPESASVLPALNRLEQQPLEKKNIMSKVGKKPFMPYDVVLVDSDLPGINKDDVDFNKALDNPKEKFYIISPDTDPPVNLNNRPHFSDYINVQDKVIDLTKDDVPPVSKLDSCSITISAQETLKPVLVFANATPLVSTNAATQRSNSKKTASLRAVRIKAPSERQKETKIMTSSVVDQVEIQKASETSMNEICDSLDSINVLAIQQAEISSTQQNKVSISKSVAATDSCSEATKLKLDGTSSVAIQTIAKKDKAYDNLGSIPMTKSTSPTSGAHTKTSVRVVSYEETHKNTLQSSENTDTDRTPIITTFDEKKADTSDKISDCDLQNSNQQFHQEKANDDSEDDLILATIMKQKLTEQISDKNAKQLKLPVNERKKKGKKLKKNTLLTPFTNIVSYNKNENSKHARTDETFLKEIKQYKVLKKKKIENTVKEKGVKWENENQNNVLNFAVQKETTTKHALETDSKVQGVFKVQNTKRQKNITAIKNRSYKRKRLESSSVNGLEIVRDKTQITNMASRPVTKDNQDLRQKSKKYLTSSKDCNVQRKPYKTIDEQKFAKFSSGLKRNGKMTAEKSVNEASQVKKGMKKTPLRRSRRGKSLFVLQEETHHTILNVSSDEPASKEEVDDNLNIKDALFPTATKLHAYECTPDTMKSSRRKKTLQLKRKSKNKKSLDVSETNIIGESESTDKKILIESLKTTNSTNVHSGLLLPNQQILHYDNVLAFKCSTVTLQNHAKLNAVSEKMGIDLCPSKAAEKRKISKTAVLETDYNSEPKKPKLYRNKEMMLHVTSDIVINEKITCYDTPVAARKTRSKSVVVKSSTSEFYDPYDIDLDEMIQKVEPHSKSPLKHTKLIGKGSKQIIESNKVSDHKNTDVLKTDGMDVVWFESILKQNSNSNKSEKSSLEYKDGSYAENTKLNEIKPKKNKTDKTFSKTDITSTNKTKIQQQVLKVDKRSDSESDSSKSDVIPLKKYVEKKALKHSQSIKSAETKKSEQPDLKAKRKDQSETPNSRRQKENRRSSVVCGSSTAVVTLPNESEEELRSEQFMESFGFFSERKPRKSNLLAAKKISETFHIIANESDDSYLDSKERVSKRNSQSENKQSSVSDKKNIQKVCEKRIAGVFLTTNCDVCQKEFRRPDNYIRHLISSLHLVKLAKLELNLTIIIGPQRPNCLVFLRESLEKTRILQHKFVKSSDIGSTQIVVPTLREIIVEVFKKAKILHLSRHRGLSRDEALFLDCCEMLKEPNKPAGLSQEISQISSHNITSCQLAMPLEEAIDEDEIANKKYLNFLTDAIENPDLGDMDSVTAREIMESEEVRNLEKKLFSELKEAYKNAESHQTTNLVPNMSLAIASEIVLPSSDVISNQNKINENSESKAGPGNRDAHKSKKYEMKKKTTRYIEHSHKAKMYPEFKEKMYPDVAEIDMFEDKFDKIKRKCRSQAAAAKQNIQVVSESLSGGLKSRKNTDKKKVKETSKKNSQSTVLTKGALKEFDGIKACIPKKDISLPAILLSKEDINKKKRKVISKNRQEKKDTETSNRYDRDHRFRDNTHSQKQVDVYEFMDNEDVELFEFRPSTLMERFKTTSNKGAASMLKRIAPSARVEADVDGSPSCSDGDDFVYMSDDYVCSDAETENSLLSYELAAVKTDGRKLSPLKRKDVVEKNVVMGKIFKYNAVRSENKSMKSKDSSKPKANLDQLFDSLLEEKPDSSNTDFDTIKQYNNDSLVTTILPAPQSESSKSNDRHTLPRTISKMLSTSPEGLKRFSSPNKTIKIFPGKKFLKPRDSSKHETPNRCILSTSKSIDIYAPSTSNAYDTLYTLESKKYETPASTEGEASKSTSNKTSKPELSAELSDDAGASVARQRTRRKCTVGKQNVLAETWSSESEPDGAPARPNTAETVVAGAGRKKKCRKKDSHNSVGRRTKVLLSKKQDIASKVSGGCRSMALCGGNSSGLSPPAAPLSPVAGPSGLCAGGGGGWKPRPCAAAYFWAAEEYDEQEQQPQHGWIVGDSHKKLVTMLAHAKGRKRNNDEKRHFIE